jgi:hypothetical protein
MHIISPGTVKKPAPTLISRIWSGMSQTALYALSKRIWKDFVIQIKAGIFPSEAIIVEDGKRASDSVIFFHFMVFFYHGKQFLPSVAIP